MKRTNFSGELVTYVEDQKRILHSCHSDPTSGHFVVTKTWHRLAERFYWNEMYQDVKNLVEFVMMNVAIINKLRYILFLGHAMP